MKTLILVAAIAALAAPVAAKVPAANLKGHELTPKAEISLTNARAIALKARAGKITDQELEKEAGGSGLRYSFDVTSHGKSYEVGVDAMTGKVLENGVETAAKEKAEVRTERREKEIHPQH